MQADFQNEGTLAYPNLIAGPTPRVTETHIVASGAGDLSAGAVLAKDSNDDDKLVLVDSGSGTASIQTAYGVLGADVDATSDDVEAIVHIKGHFNELALTFGGTDTVEDHREALRGLGIFLSKNQEA
ncbi:MAG TPA: head decoration protein [Wenzhouxiangella sp.]|nr:head decoration protein [Wenzhouxiangella sp.]